MTLEFQAEVQAPTNDVNVPVETPTEAVEAPIQENVGIDTPEVEVAPVEPKDPIAERQALIDKAAIQTSGKLHLDFIFKIYADIANEIASVIAQADRPVNWTHNEIKALWDSKIAKL